MAAFPSTITSRLKRENAIDGEGVEGSSEISSKKRGEPGARHGSGRRPDDAWWPRLSERAVGRSVCACAGAHQGCHPFPGPTTGGHNEPTHSAAENRWPFTQCSSTGSAGSETDCSTTRVYTPFSRVAWRLLCSRGRRVKQSLLHLEEHSNEE